MRKGISPVIATVILVAVALVISVALAGWVMGIWGTLGSTGAVQIVSASLYKNGTGYNLNVTVVNRGNAPSFIYAVNLSNATSILSTSCTLPESVGVGSSATINCTVSDVKAGAVYTIEMATSEGVITYQVRAKG